MTVHVYISDLGWAESFMFNKRDGFETVRNPKEADIIVWTGGADVDPHLYGQTPIPATSFSPGRDARDKGLWDDCISYDNNKLKVGICRGGQFLNVMNGGSMWQHVNNHTGKEHRVIDVLSSKEYICTSTHHQMMRHGKGGELIGIAKEATQFIDDKGNHVCKTVTDRDYPMPTFDEEVVWYPKTKSLCFQPHPEFKEGPCRQYFFDLIHKVL